MRRRRIEEFVHAGGISDINHAGVMAIRALTSVRGHGNGIFQGGRRVRLRQLKTRPGVCPAFVQRLSLG